MRIHTEEQLRTLYNPPSEKALRKELTRIDHHIERFISLSPFLVIASGNTQYQMDASPRGGAAGFVKILDDRTLLIPDALGNNRLDSLLNILGTGHAGLLFFVPGMNEMLRVNGKASLHTDAVLIQHFQDMQNQPRVVIKVAVESAYLHCAKAAMRSALWKKENHVDRSVLPTMGELLRAHTGLEGQPESQEAMLKRYEKEL